MKKKRGMSFAKRVSHFFRHYFVLLLLAILCAVLTVVLVAYCSSAPQELTDDTPTEAIVQTVNL